MRLLTPRQHRQQIRRMCQIGAQPTSGQITRAYFRYVARAIRQATS